MSKRKKNYPDPMEIVNKYGADALRWVRQLKGAAIQSFPSPTPLFLFFGSRPIFRADKTPKIPFLGLSLLPNPTETLATQVTANKKFNLLCL